jgi:hypothetical protein
MAVCDKTFHIYSREPYGRQITALPPAESVPLEGAASFDCKRVTIRDPKETKEIKGSLASLTMLPSEDCCSPGGDCC